MGGRPLPERLAGASGVVARVPAVDLGHVPLDVVVQHTFLLHNAGPGRARFGQATVAVLEWY